MPQCYSIGISLFSESSVDKVRLLLARAMLHISPTRYFTKTQILESKYCLYLPPCTLPTKRPRCKRPPCSQQAPVKTVNCPPPPAYSRSLCTWAAVG